MRRLEKFLENTKLIYYIVVLSLMIKIFLLFTFPLFDFPDGRAYLNIAKKIFENNFLFPSDELMDAPIGPYFFSFFYPVSLIFGVKWLMIGNIVAATLLILVVYKIGLLFLNIHGANIAALVTVVYPYFNFYAIHPLLETFYIFIIYSGLYFAMKLLLFGERKYFYYFTVMFTLGILTRFTGLAMLPPFLLLLGYSIYRRQGARYATKASILSIVIFLLLMSPWWIRNYYVHEEFVATSQGYSGLVFYTGNNPMNKSGGGITGIDVDFSAFEHIINLKERDNAMKETAINWILENPADWFVLEVRKLIRFYSPIIFTDYFSAWYFQLISIATYGIVFALFLFSFYYRRDIFFLTFPMLLYLILLTGVHLVFIASLRYRLPLEPYMIIMASGVVSKYFFSEKNEKNQK